MTLVKQATDEELQRLYRAFANIDDPAWIEALIQDLCTISELNEMSQRLTVAFMLNDGESYAAIQEKTGASASTIARVSKCLNHGSGAYHHVIENEG